MTWRIALRAAWLALPLLVTACGTTREGLVLDTRRVPASELIERVREASDRVRTIAGSGTLVFDSPRVSGSAEFTLALRKPDSLLVRLEGPFGMDVGLLFMDGESYVAYNSLENEVIVGASDSAALRALIPVPLSTAQIVDAFSGRYPINPDARVLRYGIDDDRFLLTALCGTDTCRYWVDPEALVVTSYRRTGPDGRVLLEGEMTKLTTIDDIQLPRSIVLRAPSRRSTLRILFADLDVNGDAPDFSYTVPANARHRTRPRP
jgi:hypothetical protein